MKLIAGIRPPGRARAHEYENGAPSHCTNRKHIIVPLHGAQPNIVIVGATGCLAVRSANCGLVRRLQNRSWGAAMARKKEKEQKNITQEMERQRVTRRNAVLIQISVTSYEHTSLKYGCGTKMSD